MVGSSSTYVVFRSVQHEKITLNVCSVGGISGNSLPCESSRPGDTSSLILTQQELIASVSLPWIISMGSWTASVTYSESHSTK